MLPKKHRLTTREVAHVARRGTSMRAGSVLVRYCPVPPEAVPTPSLAYTKFAVVMSKKVEPSAVARHAARRAVYQVLHKELSILPDVHATVILMAPHRTLVQVGAYQTIPDTLRKCVRGVS